MNNKFDDLVRTHLEGRHHERGNLRANMAKHAEYRGTFLGKAHGFASGSFFAFLGCSRSCASGKCCGREHVEGADEEAPPPFLLKGGHNDFEEEVVDMRPKGKDMGTRSQVPQPQMPAATRASQAGAPATQSPVRETAPLLVSPPPGGNAYGERSTAMLAPGAGHGSAVDAAPERGGMFVDKRY